MAGFGSLAKPYVENPFAGRITNVHWRNRGDGGLLSGTAIWVAWGGPPDPGYIDISAYLLTRLSQTGTLGIATTPYQVIIGTFAGFSFAITLDSHIVEGALGIEDPFRPLSVSLIEVDPVTLAPMGTVIDTHGTTGGGDAEGRAFALSGELGSDITYYNSIYATLTLSMTQNPP